jgi:hypothetical protein
MASSGETKRATMYLLVSGVFSSRRYAEVGQGILKHRRSMAATCGMSSAVIVSRMYGTSLSLDLR